MIILSVVLANFLVIQEVQTNSVSNAKMKQQVFLLPKVEKRRDCSNEIFSDGMGNSPVECAIRAARMNEERKAREASGKTLSGNDIYWKVQNYKSTLRYINDKDSVSSVTPPPLYTGCDSIDMFMDDMRNAAIELECERIERQRIYSGLLW